jgi:hypothetical protein
LRFERVLRNWSGVALALMGVIATIWLAATGRLTLYVHPRYTVLTIMMAMLTLLALVLMAAPPPQARTVTMIMSLAHQRSPGCSPGPMARCSSAQRWRC